MIVWNGLGILSFFAVAVGLMSIMWLPAGPMALIGVVIGLAVAAGNWWLGMKLNEWGPKQQVDTHMAAVSQQVYHDVQHGQFWLGPGHPRPRSAEEARAQADWWLGQEHASMSGLRNRHRLFWIPMQYISFLLAAGVVVLGFARLVG